MARSFKLRSIRNAVLGVGLSTALIAGMGAQANAASLAPTAASKGSISTAQPGDRYDPQEICKTTPGLKLYPQFGSAFKMMRSSKGDYVPVVMVHGWTGDRDAFTGPVNLKKDGSKTKDKLSLVGKVQSIPGAAVYGYDYHAQSTRWIDQSYLGLQDAIHCLYTSTQRKVIVMAHSMGGLATKLAVLNGKLDGEVSEVVTFGTPYTGSDIARELWALTGEKEGQFNIKDPERKIRSVLTQKFFDCSQKSQRSKKDLAGCKLGNVMISTLISNFNGDAGRALRANSDQILTLANRKWPSQIRVVPLAGDLNLGDTGKTKNGKAAKASWTTILNVASKLLNDNAKKLYGARVGLGLNLQRPGDIAGNVVSATKDGSPGEWNVLTCSPLALTKKQSYPLENIGKIMGSPCLHTNLMNSIDLVKVAVSRAKAQIAREVVPYVQSSTKPLQLSQISGWKLNSNGLGEIHLNDHSESVTPKTGVDYSGYINRWADDQNGAGKYCTRTFTSLLQNYQPGVYIGFDYMTDNRNNAFTTGMDKKRESVASLYVVKTGTPSQDALLPKTDHGIGIGSTQAQLFAAYNDPEDFPGYSGMNKLQDTTNSTVRTLDASMGEGDRTFQINEEPGDYKGYDMGNVLNFKVSNGVVVGMEVGSYWNDYQEPPVACMAQEQRPVMI